jgi:hypothetical protein
MHTQSNTTNIIVLFFKSKSKYEISANSLQTAQTKTIICLHMTHYESLGAILVDFKLSLSRLQWSSWVNLTFSGLFWKHVTVLWIVYGLWLNTTEKFYSCHMCFENQPIWRRLRTSNWKGLEPTAPSLAPRFGLEFPLQIYMEFSEWNQLL